MSAVGNYEIVRTNHEIAVGGISGGYYRLDLDASVGKVILGTGL